MIGKVVMLLAIATLFCFMAYIIFTKEPLNKAYIKYIIYAYPFISIDLVPSVMSFNIFDFITLVFFFLFYEKHQKSTWYNSPYKYIWLIFLIIIAIGLVNAEEITRDTLTSVLQLITIYLFVVIVYRELNRDDLLKNEIIKGLQYLLIFSFTFLFLQYFFGPSFSFAKSENINVAGGAAIRYPSFFQDPQKYAQFLAVLSFVVLVQMKTALKKEVIFSRLLAVIAVCALLLTGGRAGLGGWFFGLILLSVFANNMYRAQLILLLISLGLFAFLYHDDLPIFKRADLQDSYVFRQLIWEDALEIFKIHPWFGIGIGNYANYVSIHHPDQFWIHNNEITFFDHPESGYLKLLVEFGLLGFLVFLLLLIFPLVQLFKAFKNSKQIEYVLYLSAIISWLIGFYTVYSFGDVRIKVLMALILVLSVSSSQKLDLLEK